MSIIVNSRISFVFALMKCSFAAFGEQNKIDNDSQNMAFSDTFPTIYNYNQPPLVGAFITESNV